MLMSFLHGTSIQPCVCKGDHSEEMFFGYYRVIAWKTGIQFYSNQKVMLKTDPLFLLKSHKSTGCMAEVFSRVDMCLF